jgi:hypothetical protein
MALEVVAGIDDDGQLAGRQNLLEPVGELGSADTSGKANDAHLSSERQRSIGQSVTPGK